MQAPRTSHSAANPAIAIKKDDRLVRSEHSRPKKADEWRSDATQENDPEPLEEAGYGHGV